jgi:hypothetical protein
MKVFGTMTKLMDRADSFTKKVMSTLEISKLTKLMDMEL